MPLALLLSPDDQAVAAITAVLEEMSVTCERPLDGASAAQKLNSNRFDLVLVDCENLPAAKLIFDVCRNRKGGSHPVPVAVVDGRAGLPTAFRLGAELILTKPVSKDQARVTIRTAISRVRQEESARTASSVVETTTHATSLESFGFMSQQASEQHADDAADYVAAEGRAFAAAVGSVSPMSASDPAPLALTTTPSMAMSALVAEPEAAEAATTTEIVPATGSVTALNTTHVASLRVGLAEPEAARAEEAKASADMSPAAEKSGNEAGVETITTASISPDTQSEGELPASERKSEAKSEKKSGRKSSSRLVTLFVLVVACGGFYAAWTYQPGFQTIIKEQVNHLLGLVGMAPQAQHQAPAQMPAKPTSQTPKPSPGVPVQISVPGATLTAQPGSSDPNALAGATPATTISISPNAPSPASSAGSSADGTQPGSLEGATPSAMSSPTGTTTAAKSGAIQTKPGTTRIVLSPNAVEHPAADSGSKSLASPAAKTPPRN